MTSERTCDGCGAEIAPDAPFGHCAKCLIELGLLNASAAEEGPTGSEAATLRHQPVGQALPSERRGQGEGSRFSDYELLEEIAHGGMGVVFKARQVSLNRTVAVKMIRAGQFASKEFIHRFRVEASAAAVLQHPNIVAVHEVGVHEGHHFFSMDYVAGKNLAEIVRDGPLPANRAARYVQKIAEAIHYAHQSGILHRDLKPSNVIIDANDQPRITDFGLAKQLNSESAVTLTGEVMGTPGYMPPEQASGNRGAVKAWSDVYSLGAVLYHLLTGRAPFAAGSLEETLNQVLHQDPVSLRLLNPVVPRDLDTICLKCLEKEPAKRYATAQLLADELTRFLNHEPILARPISTAGKAWRWCRRKPALATTGAVALLAIVLGFAGISWQWRNSERSQRAETAQRQRTEQALHQMELQRAEELFEADDAATALAHLALVLRRDPSNQVAAERLMSALTYRTFPQLAFPPLRHEGRVVCAQFSRDGERIVTASIDGTARVWNARTGEPLVEPFRHDDGVTFAEFSPNGQRIVTSSGSSAWLWDIASGRRLTPPLQHADIVFAARFSPDGLRVVTVSKDKTARVWDARTGKPNTGPLEHANLVSCAQFSPDGQRVVTASQDKTARVWDAQTGQPITAPLAHEAQVFSAEFSPDGQRVLTASGASVHFYPDGRIRPWFTSSGDARVWDAGTGQLLTTFKGIVRWSITSAHFDPGGQRLVTAALNYEAQVWDARTGQPVTEPMRHAKIATVEHVVWSAQFSPDGLAVVTAGADHTARVWSVGIGRPMIEPLQHEAVVYAAQFSRDGHRVLTTSEEDSARVWAVRRRRALPEPLIHRPEVRFAQFSPDGQRVLTTSKDRTVRMWDAQTGKALMEPLAHEAEVRSARFSADSERIVTVSGRSVRVWNARNGRPLAELLGHDADVLCARLSPDGRRIVTGSSNRSARVWDAWSGQPLTPPWEQRSPPISVQWSADGRRIFTACSDGAVRVWDVGVAWGANIGWVIFYSTNGRPRFDSLTGKLEGHAWGANVGWISLSNAVACVRTDRIVPSADSDSDGIADAWERQRTGNLTTLSRNGDSDGDGVTDLREYLASTDPLNPNSNLVAFTAPVSGVGPSPMIVNWVAMPGRVYRVELRDNLNQATAWVDSGLVANPSIISGVGPSPMRAVFGVGPSPLYQLFGVGPSPMHEVFGVGPSPMRVFRVKVLRPTDIIAPMD